MILGVLIACHSHVLVRVQERLDDANDTEAVSSISLHFVLETGTEKGTSTDCSWNRNSKGYGNRGNLKPELKRVPTKCVMWKGYVNRLDLKPKLKRVRQRTGLETETEKGTSTDWTWNRNWNRVRQQTGLETETEKGTSTDWTWNRNWKGYVNGLDLKPKLKRAGIRQQTGLETETEKGTSTDWTWNRNWKGQAYINRLDLIPKLKWGRQQTYGQLLTDSEQWWNTLVTHGNRFWLLTVVDWRLTVSGNKRIAMKYPGDERVVDCWRLLIDGSAAAVLSVDGWLLTVSGNKRTAVGGRRLTVDSFRQHADSGCRPVVDCWLFQATNGRRLTVDCFRQQADSGCWLLTVSDNKRTTVDCFRQQADSGWRQTVECWLFQATSGQRWSSLPTPRRRTAYRTGWLSIRTASSGWPATALGPSSSLTRRPVATHKMSKLVCLSVCQLVRLPASLSVCCQLVCLLPACLSVSVSVCCQLICLLPTSLLRSCLSAANLSVRLFPICLSANCCQVSVCPLPTSLCVCCQLVYVSAAKLSVCLPTCLCVCCQIVCVSANLSLCLLPNCLCVCQLVCVSASLSVSAVNLSVCPRSVCLSANLSVCLPV